MPTEVLLAAVDQFYRNAVEFLPEMHSSIVLRPYVLLEFVERRPQRLECLSCSEKFGGVGRG